MGDLPPFETTVYLTARLGFSENLSIAIQG
jgi:hypothetical protein